MKAMILAAGLGTRLRPWTLSHPKALVPVGGVPMLKRVIERLRDEGVDEIVINAHHFASQIIDYLDDNDFGVKTVVSDESDNLLDTGGGLLKALPLLDSADDMPFLVHNVDILSDAPLRKLYETNIKSGRGATLLVSPRESSRRLIFSEDMLLRGWWDNASGKLRPDGFVPQAGMSDYAFSGIYVARPSLIHDMCALGLEGKFGVMDYFLHPDRIAEIEGMSLPSLKIIDIGKPATLSQANILFS